MSFVCEICSIQKDISEKAKFKPLKFVEGAIYTDKMNVCVDCKPGFTKKRKTELKHLQRTVVRKTETKIYIDFICQICEQTKDLSEKVTLKVQSEIPDTIYDENMRVCIECKPIWSQERLKAYKKLPHVKEQKNSLTREWRKTHKNEIKEYNSDYYSSLKKH